MKRVALLLSVAVILSGCTPFWQKPKPEPIAIINTCPHPKPYPIAFQKQAAQERREFKGRIPAMTTLVDDYGALRLALNDCGKPKPGPNP